MDEKKITLLLTIFNRTKFTLKWLDFANKEKFDFKIFICDGGEKDHISELLNQKIYNNLDITYFKSKYYENYENFWEKFYESLSQIKSSYTYLVEDDDFIIPENIMKSYDFLEKNKDFNSSGGLETHLEILTGKKKILHIKPNSNTLSYSANDLHLRLIESLKNMYSNYNVLHRTENLKKNFQNLNKINFRNLYITELIFVLTSLLQGKSNRFNHIEYIKCDNVEFSSSKNFIKTNKFSEIISSINYKMENDFFLEILKKETELSQIDYQQVKNYLEKYIEDDKYYRLDQERILEKKFKFREILKKILGNNYIMLKKIFLQIKSFKINKKNIFTNNKYYKFNQEELKFLNKIYEEN